MDAVTARMQRLTAIGGLVFVALVVASIIVVPNPPDSHAGAAKVVTFFHAHKTAAAVSGHLILLAVVVGVVFFWYFRTLIASTPEAKNFATVGFAGALIFAVSGGVASAALYALNDVTGHAEPSTIQTLSLLQGDISGFIGEPGIALFLLASSIAIIRGVARLPHWVGWLGLVLGIATLTGLGLGFPALGLWLIISCITMLVRVHLSTETTAAGREAAHP
jgi:hypothetical protein